MICIVSFRDDPHANLVEKALHEQGFTDVMRVDLDRSLYDLDLVFSLDGFHLSDKLNPGLKATRENIKTVWWRRVGTGKVPRICADLEEVDWGECFRAALWAMESLPGGLFPFGHPNEIMAAENKLLQIKNAMAVRFQVPRTCISNNKIVLENFASTCPDLVVKPLRLAATVVNGLENYITAANVKANELIHLLQNENNSEPTFLCCQERIRKKADIRVLSMPDSSHFAFEIDTSGLPEDEVDWRVETMTFPHRQIEIPSEIEACMNKFLAAMNLTSGSFDFALTSDDQWIFLECNPNGQWLWLELKTGVELARKVASLLLAHHNSGTVS